MRNSSLTIRLRATASFTISLTLAFGMVSGRAKDSLARSEETQQRIERLRQAWRSSAKNLEFGPVRLAQTSVPVFGRAEAQFTLKATYANPFDPEQIRVDGLITRPDGRVVTVPAFFCIPYQPRRGVTQLDQSIAYQRTGAAGWRLRFAPDTPGKNRLVLQARDALGRTAQSCEQVFRAEASSRKGFVRVASGNPMFFENSADGSLFWPVGANVAYTHVGLEKKQGAPGPSTYEHYFGQAQGKMNATRVWLCHWGWLEWTPQQSAGVWPGYGGTGYYNQMIATALDRIFELAEMQGLRLMLVTEDNNEFFVSPSSMGTWAAHPYNSANGGPCREPGEFFSSLEARRLYRNRLRYIAARWGYSDALWAIDSCNDYSHPTPQQVTWVKEIHGFVHHLFEGYRPIIYGTNFRFEANAIADYRQAARGPVEHDKPNVIQECYYTPVPASFRQELHDQLWSGLARGLAGIMVWDHVLVDRTRSWDEFLRVMNFVQNLPLNRHSWQPLGTTILDAQADKAGPYQRAVVLRSYGDVPDWGARALRSRFEVNLDQDRQWLEGFSPTLFGERSQGRAWRNPPAFLFSLPTSGTLLIELKEIAGHRNTLLVSRRKDERAEWQIAATVQLDHGRRAVTQKEKWVPIPLAAGAQQVMLDVRGDWIRTESLAITYRLPKAAALVNASGWSDGRLGFVYLQNQSHSRLLNQVLQQSTVILRDLELEVRGLQDGPYRVETCDTETGLPKGGFQASSKSGMMRLRLPELQRDLALKIFPAEGETLSPNGAPF